ncbi:hypothetical protein AVEN_213568-1 [Araneus ventricosus]|uniref:DUF4817 domain-containing protein n=1 Tax=Araneus ventricosus TaxID=182803 RepID=A0A4Y2JKP5_ARAVE|nr:hypothetical protein AVEN_213568-1 [Araneus ventricosus]
MATSTQEKAYCVLEYSKTSSLIVVMILFQAQFGKEPPHRHNVIRWTKQFEETGYLCNGVYSRGIIPSRVWKELDYRLDISRITGGTHTEHL